MPAAALYNLTNILKNGIQKEKLQPLQQGHNQAGSFKIH